MITPEGPRYRTGAQCLPRCLLDRLGIVCSFLRGLYGGDLANKLGDDGVVPPLILDSGFPLGVQLLPKVPYLVL